MSDEAGARATMAKSSVGFDIRPLWSVCTINDDVLPENTAPDFEFEYVDISSVTTGLIATDLQMTTFKEAPSRARRLARPGDVVVSTVRTYLKAIAPVVLADRSRVYSTGFAVLRPNAAAMEPMFFKYALLADNFIDQITAHSVGVSYPAINASELARFSLPVPEPVRQRQIAQYLDRETTEIDAMDVELDHLVETLRERRQVVASRLHHRGLETRRLKWVMREVDDRAGRRADVLPLLSVSIHFGVQLRDESTSNQAASSDLSRYKVAAAGDVVLNRMRAFQGGLGAAPVDGVVSPDYSVLRVDDNQLTPEWAEYTMRTPEFVDAMTRALRGIGSADQGNVRTPRINVRDLLDLAIPLPPLDEQHRVVAELDEQTSRIDDMIADAQRLKALLAERRSTLITEVVTGQKEVPA